MLSLNETSARVRAAHLLVRSSKDWDALSADLHRAYDSKDSDLVGVLKEPLLDSWRAVSHKVLADTFDAAGVTVSAARHPWGIVVLSTDGRSSEPLLCELEDIPDAREAAAAYGGLWLMSFDGVMSGYDACLGGLLAR